VKKDSNKFRSGLERGMARLLEAQGVPYLYESTRLPYYKLHHYVPDFYLEELDIYIETKGRFKPEDRAKHLLIRNEHPDIDLRFVFQNPKGKLSKRSKTTYAGWCEKHDFQYSGKQIPASWFS
tara:strand:+ start:2763 stop:3131 length:369 start_codon:yes stop_codon:yes gene_type:complete